MWATIDDVRRYLLVDANTMPDAEIQAFLDEAKLLVKSEFSKDYFIDRWTISIGSNTPDFLTFDLYYSDIDTINYVKIIRGDEEILLDDVAGDYTADLSEGIVIISRDKFKDGDVLEISYFPKVLNLYHLFTTLDLIISMRLLVYQDRLQEKQLENLRARLEQLKKIIMDKPVVGEYTDHAARRWLT